MVYSTQHIATALRQAREMKGLNQRQLSSLAGVPQSHISKIENGAVDLRLTSLIELARALDLELTLVPRQTVSAVQSIVRSSERPAAAESSAARRALRELKRLQKTIAEYFSGANRRSDELEQLQRRLRELSHFRLGSEEAEAIRAANEAFKAYLQDTNNVNAVRDSLSRISSLRNRLTHARPEVVRPAYSLNEDDDA